MVDALGLHPTELPGLLVVDLPIHGDVRGWFKENWQRHKMTALGMPDFGPVQHNVAYNGSRGVTRGVHAEPWDKLVSVLCGRVFGAWVDLREGRSFGTTFFLELDPGTAVFVPRGVGNAYQVLEDQTIYSYLVNDHWSPAAKSRYSFLNLADETVAIEWPIPLAEAVVSEADRSHPRLAEALPVLAKKTLVLGARGQLGKALLARLPDAESLTRADADLTDPHWADSIDLSGVGAIINAAAYTAVDTAESHQGRRDAWAANATAVARLTEIARSHRIALVHVSSDYVFDGRQEVHTEDEQFSPLGVYGQSKAAGDVVVATYERHYLVRTTWVVGDGKNFVATMSALAGKGVAPRVVDDQFGRLTFTEDLAAGIIHLLDSGAPWGTYNLTNSGPTQSWADVAADVYELRGQDRGMVTPVSTESYFADTTAAPRPRHSTLDLSKIAATGFVPAAAAYRLREYLS